MYIQTTEYGISCNCHPACLHLAMHQTSSNAATYDVTDTNFDIFNPPSSHDLAFIVGPSDVGLDRISNALYRTYFFRR